MLVIFKSKVAGEIIMFEENAKPILDLLGKSTQKGIILAAETGDAILKLEEEIARRTVVEAEEKAAREKKASEQAERDGVFADSPLRAVVEPVSFAARVFTFMDMLKRANEKNKDIVWGV
jgi:hypothetical protein